MTLQTLRQSLSYRIAGSMAALLMIVTAAAAAGTYVFIRRDAVQEKHALVDAMAYSLETTLEDLPRATLQRVVENYGTIAGVHKISIFDRRGIALAGTERLEIDRTTTSDRVKAFLHDGISTRLAYETDTALVILEPLRGRAVVGESHRDIVAVVEIAIRREAIEAVAEDRAQDVLAVTLAGYLMLSVALGFMLRFWVTQPISALARNADALRQGHRTNKSRLMGTGEVRRLAEAFDTMATQIDEMVRNLEADVAARTADLRAERRALEREKELLEFLFQLTSVANEAQSIEAAFSKSLAKICALTGFSAAVVYKTIKEPTVCLEATNIRFATDGFVWPDGFIQKIVFPGEGVVGRVFASGETIVEPPVAAFPLLVGAEVVGVMQFHLDPNKVVEPRFLTAVSTTGVQLGRVVERTEVARVKDEFVSVVSHELRTPLTAIHGSLGLLAHGILGELPSDALEVVQIANESSHRLVRLINDLLDVQKLAMGSFNLAPQWLDLREVLSTNLPAYQTLVNGSSVHVVLDAPSTSIRVFMDRDRLQQIMTNLISNAVKFSPPNSEILLRTQTNADRIRVEVCDRGPGIPDAFKPHIFKQFAQSDASSTRAREGTGLGLYICKRLIELQGGTIGFLDRPGGGTIFYFEVPQSPTNA